jgi:spermidine synthase
VPLLFAVTLFLSAGLLFMVQPMVGKMILPLLGGSPAVWNACMVFFQALLLLGYLYAHFVTTRLHPRRQWAVHLLVLMAPVAAMGLAVVAGPKHVPIAVADALAPSGDTSPVVSVMALLLVAIGVPFFVSATSAPLLQKWFAYTGHPSARDPYFLYAASNAGSLLSLLGYPLFIEPNMILAGQAWLWAAGFVVLIGLILACGRAAANPVGVPPEGENLPRPGKPATAAATEPPPSPGRVVRWVALAFVPSSLMLGVTFYMTTDIASVPLLWVIPLALYLVTFIIAYSAVIPPWFRLVVGNLAPVMILLTVFVTVAQGFINTGTGLTLLLHNATFFAVALMCHYELALDRPSPAHLTGYFLWISVGGVLGGIFNALVAPVVFTGASEYPVTLVIACLMVPPLGEAAAGAMGPAGGRWDYWFRGYLRGWDRRRAVALALDLGIPVLLGLVFAVLSIFLPESTSFQRGVISAARWVNLNVGLGVTPDTVTAIGVFALPVMACFFFVDRPLRFALCVAALLVVNEYRTRDPGLLHTERSFFGILKVEQRAIRDYPNFRARSLVHGTTLHGTQINAHRLHHLDVVQAAAPLGPWDALLVEGSLAAFDPRQEPLTYYHRTGPVGAMFHELRTRNGGADAKAEVAMVGLGTGSAAAYALPGQRLTFYEIDPAVRRIVEEPTMVMNQDEVEEDGAAPEYGPFTYVRDARDRGAAVDFRMGDARLKLAEDKNSPETDRKYALLMVDAFSSDAIPVHLLTKQAVELYLDRLAPGGILALHISNKYIRLEPVVARIAAELGLTARVWNDDSERRPGKTASSWVVLARDPADLGKLAAPATEQAKEFGTKNLALIELLRAYPAETLAADALARAYGAAYARYKAALDRKAAVGDEFVNKKLSEAEAREKLAAATKDQEEAEKAVTRAYGPPAMVLVDTVHKLDPAKTTLKDLTEYVAGPMFHPLKLTDQMPLWTDDYSDVLSVMMLKEVQWVRRQLGLPVLGGD